LDFGAFQITDVLDYGCLKGNRIRSTVQSRVFRKDPHKIHTNESQKGYKSNSMKHKKWQEQLKIQAEK
jgi:hypothetical protein